ncbi:helix-turn-helix domain-containing protein [Rhodoblastus acidophilus]|uniref:helix-turn-helix domain-containing protein n=1 Tax=Rhodoblastus acidophilus TaxID=1074 RepID=UPI003CD04D67
MSTVLQHMNRTGSISIREAMDDYGMSGGSLTKYISELRKNGYGIKTKWKNHPITGRRYARYELVRG